MKIACLQFAPQVGDVDHNLNRADAVLSKANPQELDLLVVPEMAFSGYNFRSLQHIAPFLEPTGSGITSLWARCKALKYNCVVSAGYPEIVDVKSYWPAGPEYYNSTITVNADGETIANYRKSHLYCTDEIWALESSSGFYGNSIDGLGKVAMGICTDLNPYQNQAPWSAWEFAHHILHVEAHLVILSCAWLTREDPKSFSRSPREPDMDTLSYWLARLEPIIRAETVGEIIVVIANRCGTEDEAVYAGTSAVLGINGGEVKVYGILGRGEKELLVVDTSEPCQAKLVSTPNVGSGISVASQSAGCEISPFHGSSSKTPGDLRTAIPFKYPTEVFSPVPQTPVWDMRGPDGVSRSGDTVRMASDLNKSIFEKHLERLQKENTSHVYCKPPPVASSRNIVHAEFNSQASRSNSKQQESIPISIEFDSGTATPNITVYEDFVPDSPPVARISQDYFGPQPHVPPPDSTRDFLQSTTGKTGLITPSPDSTTFKGLPFPRTGIEYQRSWEQTEPIPIDVNDCFSPVSSNDGPMPKPYLGLGLAVLQREMTQEILLSSSEKTERAAISPEPAVGAAIQRPESTKSHNASRNRSWGKSIDTSAQQAYQDLSISPPHIPPQKHYDDRSELRMPPPSGFPQGYFNPNLRRSRESTPSRPSTESSRIIQPSRQSTPYSEYTQEILQPYSDTSKFITQTPEAMTIEHWRSPGSRDNSCYRQVSRSRSRSPIAKFPVDSVSIAVAAIERPCPPISRKTSRSRDQSKERGRSYTGHLIKQNTVTSGDNLTQAQIMAVSLSPSDPTPTQTTEAAVQKLSYNHPAPLGTYQSWVTRTMLGARCEHIIPRPGSAMW